jgi:hypothetical protein
MKGGELIIKCPLGWLNEKKYICRVIFSVFWGIDYKLEFEERKDYEISFPPSNKKLILPDIFFDVDDKDWLNECSLPILPLAIFDTNKTQNFKPIVTDNKIPVIYGKPFNQYWIIDHDQNVYLGIDIFGSIFFMLTRYEEVLSIKNLDSKDRFPAKESIAYKANFLHRPIVNEYIEIMWSLFSRLWPYIQRRKKKFQMIITHDVDAPYEFAFKSIYKIIRITLGKIYRKKSFIAGVNVFLSWYKVRMGQDHIDPYYTFDWIMDQEEKANLKSAFYFISDRSSKSQDCDYSIYHQRLRDLLRKINSRGHEIGFHYSYNSYTDPQQTKKEVIILKEILKNEGIEQSVFGGRQHCLRFKIPDSFQNIEDAGVNYDSSMGYPDLCGFRCGVCFSFPVFSLLTRKQLKLYEYPLIVQESTVMSSRYMNIKDCDKVIKLMLGYKNICKTFSGDFVFLWHNSNLTSNKQKKIFQAVLES